MWLKNRYKLWYENLIHNYRYISVQTYINHYISRPTVSVSPKCWQSQWDIVSWFPVAWGDTKLRNDQFSLKDLELHGLFAKIKLFVVQIVYTSIVIINSGRDGRNWTARSVMSNSIVTPPIALTRLALLLTPFERVSLLSIIWLKTEPFAIIFMSSVSWGNVCFPIPWDTNAFC